MPKELILLGARLVHFLPRTPGFPDSREERSKPSI